MITKAKASTAYDEENKIVEHYDWRGLSDDTKPTEGVAVNDLFLEVDTGDGYYFDGTDWLKIGG